jgi:hypothetical protein
MGQEKYIGLDVHQATISAAVMDASGKLLMECLMETKAATILEFTPGIAWNSVTDLRTRDIGCVLHDLLKPHVSWLVVCDPRKAALLKEGNKSDRIDARKLAELLRTNQLKPVYHGEHGIRTLKELQRSYLTVSKEVTRTMNRIKYLRVRACISLHTTGGLEADPRRPFNLRASLVGGNWPSCDRALHLEHPHR